MEDRGEFSIIDFQDHKKASEEQDHKKASEEQVEQNLIVTPEDLFLYFFGMKPDNPENVKKILEKLEQDKHIIRKKYGLPPKEMLLENPAEYERKLRKLLRRESPDVEIVSRLECSRFF